LKLKISADKKDSEIERVLREKHAEIEHIRKRKETDLENLRKQKEEEIQNIRKQKNSVVDNLRQAESEIFQKEEEIKVLKIEKEKLEFLFNETQTKLTHEIRQKNQTKKLKSNNPSCVKIRRKIFSTEKINSGEIVRMIQNGDTTPLEKVIQKKIQKN